MRSTCFTNLFKIIHNSVIIKPKMYVKKCVNKCVKIRHHVVINII